MNLFELKAELRSDLGKGASRRLRRLNDKVPGIVYGGDTAPTPIMIDHSEVLHHVEHEAFYSHILTLIIDGKKNSVVLRDLQRHPFKPKITHMDFQRVKQNETIHMQVPLHFINEEKCVGVKAGGQIIHNKVTVEVECKAKDLPEFIEVDVAALELGSTLHLSDMTLPKGVTLMNASDDEESDLAVVSVAHSKVATESTDSEESSEKAGE